MRSVHAGGWCGRAAPYDCSDRNGNSAGKPGITFAAPTGPETVASELVLRVPDCQSAYETLKSRGASFLTPPVKQEWGGEIRCFFQDPDGHLIEVSELLGEG